MFLPTDFVKPQARSQMMRYRSAYKGNRVLWQFIERTPLQSVALASRIQVTCPTRCPQEKVDALAGGRIVMSDTDDLQ
jgi:hypothetical protein